MNNKLTIISSRNFGFFTNFFHTLQHIDLAIRNGRTPVVHWSGGPYKDREYNGVKNGNVWEYFFEPVSSFSIKDAIKYKDVENVCKFRQESLSHEPPNCWRTLHPPKVCLTNMSMECKIYVNELIKKYIKIKDIVQNKIYSFYDKNMAGHNIIGIHWRGCKDQRAAQGYQPGKEYISRITEYLQDNPHSKIFVATDKESCLKKVIKTFGKDRIISYPSLRSKTKYPFSMQMRDIRVCLRKKKILKGAKPAEDALIECILLSKCNYFLRAWSNMSAAVGCFNPNLQSYFIPIYTQEYKKYLEIDQ